MQKNMSPRRVRNYAAMWCTAFFNSSSCVNTCTNFVVVAPFCVIFVVFYRSKTVLEIIVGDPGTFSSLLGYSTQADLVDTLSNAQGITLFAPTNGAFKTLTEAAPDVAANLKTEEWKNHLEDLFYYHVLPTAVPSSDITDGLSVTTLNEDDIDFTVSTTNGGGTSIFVNTDAEVVEADIDAKNGIIHAIDDIILPSWISNSIMKLAEGASDLSTFVDLVAQAGFSGTLSGAGPYTVFAPTNAAFLDSLFGDGTFISADRISSIISYHVVEGIYPDTDLRDGFILTTLQGEKLTFKRTKKSGEFVNDERIIIPNILANNGIVHFIDGVLIPEG
jgi:transforming growth factor-beta-induced protein